MGKVSIVSLGCPKNLVDSENLLKKLRGSGVDLTDAPEAADIILVNTCGFIEAAKKESVDEILRLSEIKAQGGNRKLVVFGCLAQRYREELLRELPEIDALWGVGKEGEIADYCFRHAGSSGTSAMEAPPAQGSYAYLKIAEGCDRACSYCVIPGIRGAFKSRDPEEIIGEAEAYIRTGTKELIMIAQDITSYGKGLAGYSLGRLLREIAALDGDFRIRLLYLYPTSLTGELLQAIADEKKICRYIDMPLQHSEDAVLRRMGRGGSRDLYRKIIGRIRGIMPEVALRTTFIVGFPGESERDFEGLLDFVREMAFDRLGVFMYSREEGTPAYDLKGAVSRKVREMRYSFLMEAQAAISLEKNSRLVGRTFRVLVDEVSEGVAVARLCSQAPEIDGVVFIRDGAVQPNRFVEVTITKAYDYDLEGIVTA